MMLTIFIKVVVTIDGVTITRLRLGLVGKLPGNAIPDGSYNIYRCG